MTVAPRFSVVIPTFRRRDIVVGSVKAFERQSFEAAFEVIVVVDGSQDGTANALRSLKLPFPLTVIEQPNSGASSARNRGAGAAFGEILLFLDDDMEPDPGLLAEHEASHRAGAAAVLGHLPLHPGSPQTFLSAGVKTWADDRAAALGNSNARISPFDVLTGNLSVRREVFDALGGFDGRFTRDGAFGNEDLEFGIRLLDAKHRVVFNPKAISRQLYAVGFQQHLEQWRDVGRADVALAHAQPGHASTLRRLRSMNSPLQRALRVPAITKVAATAAVRIAERWPKSRTAARIFYLARSMAHWDGVRESGGMPDPGSLRILSYHSIDRRRVSGELADYSLHPSTLENQIINLKRTGFTFVQPEKAIAFIEGRESLPKRSLLLSFDDGYVDFAEEAVPILAKHEVPAVVFAVTGRLGETNDWDTHKGGPSRPLMSAADLRRLHASSVQVGAHSRSHRALVSLPADELMDEVDGSMADLQALQLNTLGLFCYPYGAFDDTVESRLRAAGARAAFTVEPGVVAGQGKRFRLPRIEILRRDGAGIAFLWKVWSGGRGLSGTLKRRKLPLQTLSAQTAS